MPAVLVLLAFLCIFFWGMNEAFPLLGHDFYYVFPRLLAGKWHFWSQGFAPFRYAPQLCGGFPVYGNPHDFFYSLPQVLSLFLNLWTAVQWSIAAALIAGYIGWYRFGRDALHLSDAWAHVLALVILSNGYYFMHMIVGHLSYQTLPLMGWFLWFAYDTHLDDRRRLFVKSVAAGLLGAYVLYAAGYFVLLLSGATFLLFLPLDLLFRSTSAKKRLLQIGTRVAAYGSVFFLLAFSKFVAIWSLMRFLPRTVAFDTFPSGISGLWFILKSFFVLPQGSYLFPSDVDKWGIHEYSMFLSPLVLIGCIFGAWEFGKKRWRLNKRASGWLVVYVLLLLIAFAQFTVGHGLLIDWLKHLPIFSSLRVTVRFLYVLAVLLSIGGVVGLSRTFTALRHSAFVVPVAGAITLLSFFAAYAPLLWEQSLILTVPYDQMQKQLDASSYLNQYVEKVHLLPAVMPSDLQSVLSASTSPGCYEPLLDNATFRKPLVEGLTSQVKDDAYNIYNPACLEYPKENHCAPGDRIAVTDAENFKRFVNGLPDTWKMSSLQYFADALSFLAFIVAVLLCVGTLANTVRRRGAHHTQKHHEEIETAYTPLEKRMAAVMMNVRDSVLRKSPASPERFRQFLTALFIIIGVGFVAYICAFQVLDRDFWWHITAGKVMLQRQALIQTEPFSYTRAGMPYLANHEWLAQIILYVLYAAGGSTAIILFRTCMMLLALGILLCLNRRSIWLMMPIAILAANAIRPAFIERPQLFTFVIFSACLYLTMRVLDLDAVGGFTKHLRVRYVAAFAVLQVLWVNMHGGAAMLGLLFPGVLFADAAVQWVRATPHKRAVLESFMRWTVLLGALLFIALFLSPTTYHNITYVWNLLTDRTIIYIQEWQPRAIGDYLFLIGPFWILAAIAIAVGRKQIVASSLLVLVTGYLSHHALRHEPLFVLATLAVIIHQIPSSDVYLRASKYLLQRPLITVLTMALLVFGLADYTHAEYASFVKADQLAGYGTFDFGSNAVDFLEREHINGKMFNTYGIGGYLIHRGYPDPARKVFIDGRNVDYGFSMMNQTYLAGIDPVQWQKLSDQYGFTYAVIDYFSNKDQKKNLLRYSQFLDKDPQWSLVYFDDWVAIYLKKAPENQAKIDHLGFHLITATNMEFKTVIDALPASQFPALEQELKRAITDSPRSIKARIMLAKLFVRQNRLDEAQVVAQDAAIAQPNSPEPHALFAAIFVMQKQWKTAADELSTTLQLAGTDYPDIDYAFVAQVFAQAGRLSEAKGYARRAGQTLVESAPPTAATATGSLAPVPPTTPGVPPSAVNMPPAAVNGQQQAAAPMVNPEQDAIDFENKALQFAQNKQNDDARTNFLIALKLNPSFAEAWNNLGTLSFFEGKFDEAKTEYDRALKISPKYADVQFNMALLLLKTGHKDVAKPYMDQAKKLGKDTGILEQMMSK